MDKLSYELYLGSVFKKVPRPLLKVAEKFTRKSFIRPAEWIKDIDHIEILYTDETQKVSRLQVEAFLHNRLTILDTKFSGLLTLDSIFLAIFAFSVRNRSLEYYNKCEIEVRYVFTFLCLCFIIANFFALWYAGERYYARFYLMHKQKDSNIEVEFASCVKKYSSLTYKRLTYLHFALFLTVISTIAVSGILVIAWYPTLGFHSHIFSVFGACRR